MRLVSLGLEKFGPFTQRRIDFRGGALLHIVHGANEAGKTSALAAVHGLLFGIPERTSYDFLHKAPEMRLAGEIEARDGRRLAFRRRKGRKSVLSDAAGADLPDDALRQYLGGMSEDVFLRAFGLDSENLRKGAAELLASGGDAAESMLAAASGLRGLSRLRAGLESDADEIFAQRASKDRLVYQILERYEAARKQSAALELGAGKWSGLNDDIRNFAQQREAIAGARKQLQSRLTRLARFSSLKPLMSRIDAEEEKLRLLDAAAEPPIGFGADLARALERRGDARREAAKMEAALEAVKIERGKIIVDAALIARNSEIVALFSRTSGYNDARRDLPRVHGETAGYLENLAENAIALGLKDSADISARQPAAAAQARIAALITSGEELTGQRGRNAADLAAEEAVLDKLAQARDARAAIADPGPLREKLAAIGDPASLLERAKQAAAALDHESVLLAEEARRLTPPVADPGIIAAAALPGPATIARFRADLAAAAAKADAERAKGIACRSEIERLEARLHELAGDRPVASADRIRWERGQRQAFWPPLRAALFGEEGAPSGAALASAVARFESSMTEADSLADEGARDAARVAAFAEARAQLADKRKLAGNCGLDLAQADSGLARLESEWAAVWSGFNFKPLPPEEMTLWLSMAGALLHRREKLLAQRPLLSQSADEIARLEAPLAALAAEAGLPPLPGLDAGRQAARISERIKALAEPWDAARGDARAMSDTKTRIAAMVQRRDAIEEQHHAWRAAWEDAAAAFHLRAGASLAEARVTLELWARIPALLGAHKNRQGRVDGMNRNIEEFTRDTAQIVEAAAPDLRSLAPPDAVRILHSRLGEAARAEVSLAEAEKREAAAADALALAQGAEEQASRGIDALASRAPDFIDLETLSRRLIARDACLAELEGLRRQFFEQPGSPDINLLREDLASFDAREAESEMAELAAEDARLVTQGNEAYAEESRLLRQRADWEKGTGSEASIQQRRNAEAELGEAARKWAVLKFGALLLEHALSSHRAGRKDPLMRLAGDCFATLTGGRFAGLEQEYGEDDQPKLAGRRADGRIIFVDGLRDTARSPMSTGTLDQLYLALRLAYIEDYCSRSEPIPFIGDDLFTSFDDARTGHGIEALARLSQRTQTILFTHHRHVAEIARARLGDGLDLIELG